MQHQSFELQHSATTEEHRGTTPLKLSAARKDHRKLKPSRRLVKNPRSRQIAMASGNTASTDLSSAKVQNV